MEKESKGAAGAALQFLQRAQMSGAEADSYIAVRNWLTMIANGDLEVAVSRPVNPMPPQEPAPPAI